MVGSLLVADRDTRSQPVLSLLVVAFMAPLLSSAGQLLLLLRMWLAYSSCEVSVLAVSC